MPVNHAVLIPSLDNAPDPSGTLQYPDQPGSTQTNPLICGYPCTVEGHSDTVGLLYVDPATVDYNTNYDDTLPGPGFSLPASAANDPNVGEIDIKFDPPLT